MVYWKFRAHDPRARPTNKPNICSAYQWQHREGLSLPHNEAVIQVGELAMALNQSEELNCSLML